MYKSAGARSGAWLAEKEEAYKSPRTLGISNYGLVPVTYKNEDLEWKRTKKEIGQGFRRLRGKAATASKKAGKKIKDYVSKNPGYVASLAAETLGLGAKCLGADGMDGIADGLITLGFGPALGQYVSNANARESMKAEREKIEIQRKRMEIETEIRDMLREIAGKPVNGKLDQKIYYKGELKNLLNSVVSQKGLGEEQMDKIQNQRMGPMMKDLEDLYGTDGMTAGNNVG